MPISPYDRIAVARRICGEILLRVSILPRRTQDQVKLCLTFTDGSKLYVTETWSKGELEVYSYYWVDAQSNLIIGWDNAPHHTQIETFPHHKHVGDQSNRQPSEERCLEDVLQVIARQLRSLRR